MNTVKGLCGTFISVVEHCTKRLNYAHVRLVVCSRTRLEPSGVEPFLRACEAMRVARTLGRGFSVVRNGIDNPGMNDKK